MFLFHFFSLHGTYSYSTQANRHWYYTKRDRARKRLFVFVCLTLKEKYTHTSHSNLTTGSVYWCASFRSITTKAIPPTTGMECVCTTTMRAVKTKNQRTTHQTKKKNKKDKGGTCYWYMLTLRIIADFKAKEEKNIK